MSKALLSTAYWAPIDWYAALLAHDEVIVDGYEHYVKQTWRNRCRIVMPDGVQDLVLPVEAASSHAAVRDLRISDHGQWQHHHWNALQTAYGRSPFFEYYADEIAPFYERHHAFLLDFNEELRMLVCRFLQIEKTVELSEAFVKATTEVDDLRQAFSPRVLPKTDMRPYYQVFSQQVGFQPHLSIADLLFNMGPEAIFWLLPQASAAGSSSMN